MPRDFHYYPPSFDIPTLPDLREEWSNIPYFRLREAVVIEHQYLLFHLFMVENTRHTENGGMPSDTTFHLSSNVRASALKAAILTCTSIIEAALLAHALKRKYKDLHSNSKKRTFGNIIQSWENNENGKKEIEPFIKPIKKLCEIRNHIHLERIAQSDDEFYKCLLKKEKDMLQKTLRIIEWLQAVKSI